MLKMAMPLAFKKQSFQRKYGKPVDLSIVHNNSRKAKNRESETPESVEITDSEIKKTKSQKKKKKPCEKHRSSENYGFDPNTNSFLHRCYLCKKTFSVPKK